MRNHWLLTLSALVVTSASAHFQVLLPQSDALTPDNPKVKLEMMFMHPFEGSYMQMDKPQAMGVFANGKKTSLLDTLKKGSTQKMDTWHTEYRLKKPGDHIFYVDPVPYFEPAEGKFIRHLTKVTVNGFGMEEGWDESVGFKAEILPLTRPYGLYKGNLFQGQVMFKGKPVPFAEVEVEHLNQSGHKAPTELHITQVIKADANGVFSYAMPFEGWWGFAALLEDDVTIKHTDGKSYPVELGAVFWTKTY